MLFEDPRGLKVLSLEFIIYIIFIAPTLCSQLLMHIVIFLYIKTATSIFLHTKRLVEE